MRRVIVLLSGGIDSPVAAWHMINIGCEVILVHFYNYTYLGNAVKEKIIGLARVLKSFQSGLKLYLVPFKETQREIIKFIPSKLRMIVTRRLMFMIADKILEKEKAQALVTGDSLAQVASQTLDNLKVIYKATKYPVLTPLIGENKEDIIKTAREIGTFELSIEPYSDCCSFLVDPHPELRGDIKKIKEVESHLSKKQLIERAFEMAKIKEI